MSKLEFILNGERVSKDIIATKRLIDVLRDDFSLTGVKEGCGEGECGACSVLIDGMIANSCLVPVGNVVDKEIVTIEYFSQTEQGKAIKKSFVENGAVQCGICTPGMVMAAQFLLSTNKYATTQQIRHALEGNLCRCTGYEMIIKSIEHLQQSEESLW